MARPPRPAHLPLRAGVAPSAIAVSKGNWATALDFLSARLPTVSPAEWADRMAQQQVLNEQGEALNSASPCPPCGRRLYYYRHIADEVSHVADVRVLFQDEHLLVVDKPHGLPVNPSGRFVQHSLLVWLRRHLHISDLSPLHRIDRETAGLVVFSMQAHERGLYQALFRQRCIDKRYLALAAKPPSDMTWPQQRCTRLMPDPAHFFRMVEVNGPANTDTHLDYLGPLTPCSAWGLYQLAPSTGQRHQLRVHMNALGLPLLGDQLYPTVRFGPGEEDDSGQTLQLLAQSLRFTDPITQETRAFTSTRQLACPDACSI
jgi:tRNA pseudouridine32 synthase/23S rRNA pseudouridine746 synthase